MANIKAYETGFKELYFQVLDEDGKTLETIPGLDKLEDAEDGANAFRRLRGAKSLTSTDESNQSGVLADDDPNYLILSASTATSGSLTMVGITDEFKVAVLGYSVDSFGNVINLEAKPRLCHLMFTRTTHKGTERVILYNVQFTANDNLDVQTGTENEPSAALDFTVHGIKVKAGKATKTLKMYKIKDTDERYATVVEEGAPTEITLTDDAPEQ